MRHLLLVLMILASAWAVPGIGASEVMDGVLDLSRWKEPSFVSLNGTWMSIEDELVEGKDLSAHVLTPIPVPTPSEFRAEAGHGRYQRTYVLRIKGLRIDRPMALWSQGMAIWSQRFIFYQDATGLQYELGQIGKVDPDPGKRLHLYTGAVAIQLPTVQGDGTLLIQTNANPFYQGVLHPYRQTASMEIGPADPIKKKSLLHLSEESFTLGLFALMMLFNLALFIQRPQEKSTLYLAGLTCAFTWRYVCTDGYLPKVMDHTHNLFVFTTTGVTFATPVATFFLSLFLRATYPKQVPRYVPAIFIPIFGAMLINLLFVSLYDLQNKWVQYTLLLIPIALYLCYLSLRAALAGEEGATLGIYGFGTAFIGHFNDFLVATQVYDFIYLGHYSLVLLIFTQSLVVGRRFALAFKRTLLLGRELQAKNETLVKHQAEIQSLNQSLKDYAETLEHKVEEKTRDIVSILNNIRQGIVAVKSPEGELAREHSLYLEAMFGIQKTEGMNVLELCFSESNVRSDQMDQLRNALAMIIGEDPLAFDMNQSVLPTEISRSTSQGVQFLELDWSPVIAGSHVEKLLLVMRDVTEIKRLRLEAEDQAAELKLIADIIKVPKERFEGLMDATVRLIEANRDVLLRLKKLDDGSVDRLYRNLHTVKGMMRSYQLQGITDIVHNAENRFKAIKAGVVLDSAVLLDDLEKILSLIRRLIEINQNKLGRSSIQDHHYILIDKRQFEENLRNIREIDFQRLQAEDQSRFERIRTLFFKVAYTPLSKVLEAQLEGLSHLARSLNKTPPLTNFIDQGFSINREIHESINNIFTHLLRNSIDHGLETRELRMAKGKAPAGLITFKLSSFHGQLRIEYFDDGAGMDLHKIRQKAIEKNLLRPDQDVTRQQLVDLILQSGFSTSERVTDISGRGVGMDAVRSFVEEIDGRFEIKVDEPNSSSLEPIPAHFVIILPEHRFQKIDLVDPDPSSKVA